MDEALSFEVDKLRVGFVWGNDVGNVELLEVLDQGGSHFWGDVDAFLEFLGGLGRLSGFEELHGDLFFLIPFLGAGIFGSRLAWEEVSIEDHVGRDAEMAKHPDTVHGGSYVPKGN